MNKLIDKLTSLGNQRFKESIWLKIGIVLSVITVFCISYALIIPGLTLSTHTSRAVVQEPIPSSSNSERTADEVKNSKELPASQSPNQDKSTDEKKLATHDSTTDARNLEKQKQTATIDNVNIAGSQSVDVEQNATVTVAYEAGTFSEKVSLKVTPVNDTNTIVSKLTTLLDKSQQTVADAKSYNISFIDHSGNEVEPNKAVSVSMVFKDDTISGKPYASWKLYHFINNDHDRVEEMTKKKDTNISETSSGGVSHVEFKSDTFSTYTLANVTYSDFSRFLTSYGYNQSSFDNASQVLTVLDLSLTYHISQEALAAEKNYYLALPNDSAIGKDIALGKQYIGRNGNSVAAFNYSFNKDASGKYYVLISFLDSYINTIDKGADSKGFITYDATFGTTHKKSDGSYVVDYSDNIKVAIEADKITTQYGLNVAKKGFITYDGDQPYITYTLIVFSEDGSPAGIDLSDILTADGLAITAIDQVNVKKGSYTSYPSVLQNAENVPVTNYTYKFNKTTKKLDMTLPQLVSGSLDNNGKKIGQAYEITYRYCISGLRAGQGINVKNKATVNSDNGKKDGKKSDTANTNLVLKLNDLSKTSKGYDPVSNMITWSVTVNPDKNDIAGALLTDILFDNTSNLVLSPANGYTIEKNNNGTITGIRFKAINNNKNTQSYTLTYQTKVEPNQIGWSGKTVKNNVTLDDDGDIKTTGDQTHASASQSIAGTGDLHKSLTSTKDTDDEHIKALTWTTDITLPTSGILPTGTVFTDVLTNPWSQDMTKHWYTTVQLQALYKDLENIFGSTGFTLGARQNSWEDYKDYANLDVQKHYSEYKITLTKPYKGTNVKLTYHSMVDITVSHQFKNTVTSGTHNSSADYNYQQTHNITKMDGNENESASNAVSEDGTVTWKVKVALPDDAKSMTVVDELPQDVALAGLKYGQHWGQIDAKLSGNTLASGDNRWGTHHIELSGTTTESGKVTLNFNSQNGATLKENIGNNNEFWLTFTTKYTKLPTDNQIIVGLNNHVSATVDHQDFGSASQKQTVTLGKKKVETPEEKVVSKSGQWDNDDRILNYSVNINPDGKILADGADQLTLRDTLEVYGTDITESLIKKSVKLFDVQGNPVPDSDWSWDVSDLDNGYGSHKHVLKLVVKNGTRYTLTYQYKIAKSSSENAATYWPRNTVSIDGIKMANTSITTVMDWQRAATKSGIETEKGYTINKVEAKNFGNALPNATFKVYAYDANSNETDDKVIATYTTNASGSFDILFSSGKFTYNKVYYVTENSAPSGYKLPDKPKRYYFFFKGENGITPFLPEGTVDLSDKSKTDYVENEKVAHATIKVNKKWLDAKGNPTELVNKSIQVHLVQVSNAQKDGVLVENTLETRSISKSDNWTTTFDNLPTTGLDNNGNIVNYTYKVVEDPVEGYKTSYYNNGESSDATPISSGDIMIINQAQMAYQLPKTGGSGVKLLTICGLAMALLSVLCLLYIGYKRNRQGGECH